MKRHPKVWKIVKWTLITLIGLPVALVVLALLALAVPFTRRPIVNVALTKTNESLDGMRIEVDDVTRLDLWGIDIRGARLFDDEKREMVSVGRASVRLRPGGLLFSKLHLTDVGVRTVRVHIYPSTEPSKDEPEEESQPSTFQIVADQLRINDASLDMDIEGRALHAVINQLLASGAFGPRTWAALTKADVFADVDQQRALTLRSTRGTWDEKRGGEAVLQGGLLDARFLISTAVPPIDQMETWPVERAHVVITGLTNEGLARLGLADQAQLHVPVDLHLEAHRQQAQLNAQLVLQLGGDQLVVDAAATPSSYVADIKLDPTNLRQVSGVAPAMRLGLDMHAEVQHENHKPKSGQLEWRNVVVDQRAVPDGALQVELPLPLIKLKKLTILGFEQNLKLSGQYNTASGAAQVALDTSELQLSKLGGLLPADSAGTLNGGVEAQLQGKALKGNAELSLRYLRIGQTQVDSASVALDLSGSTEEPLGDVKVDARQLVVNGTKLLRTSLNAHAGLRELNGDLAVEGQDRFVSLELHGTRDAQGTIELNADGTGSWQDKRVGLTIRELRVATGAYSVRELTAFSGDERLSVSGSFDDKQRVDAAVSIVKLDLAPIGRLALQHELTGIMDMSARVSGTVQKPYVSSQIAVYGLHSERTPRAPKVDLRTSVLLDTKRDIAELTLRAESADDRVVTNVSAKAQLAKRAPTLAAAFERAQLELSLRAHTDAPFLEQFAPEGVPEMEGTFDAALDAHGDLDKAALDFDLLAQLAPRAEVGRGLHDRLELSVRLDEEGLRANVQARDRAGKLLDLKTKVILPEGGPRALMADSKKLMQAPVNLDLVLKERRLDELTGTYGVLAKQYKAALPVLLSANIAGDSTGSAVSAKGLIHAHVWGEGIDPNCAEQAQGDVQIDLALQDNNAHVKLKATPSGGGEAELTLDSALAANALLAGSAFTWGPLMVRASGDKLALHTFPSLCMLPPSRTKFDLSADDVGKGPTRAKLNLAVSDVPAGGDDKMNVELHADTGPNLVQAYGKIGLNGKPHGWFDARVPLLYENTQVPKVPMDKPISARVQLPKFPVEALASFTEAIGRAAGDVTVDMTVGGTLSTLEPTGYVQLHDAAFSLASMAQPFSNINGRIELERNKLTIRDLKARDRDGKLAVTGYAKYARERGGEAEIHMSAERFPLRQQGSIIGELSTRAVLQGKVAQDNKMKLALKIEEGRIWLTGQGGRQVQEMDEHPDIRFDTEKALLEVDEEAEKKAKAGELALEQLKIQTERELWVQHDDFSVQVGVDLLLTTQEEGVTLVGEAKLVRGDLTLLGKPFRIEKGAIRFTGDVPPDPELDLKAKHRTRQGQTLNVQVMGRASAPQIIFSGAASNAGEAALLLSGIGNNNAEGGAKRDAASFAAGLTAGLLAVSARRKFGDWVPMLAIENNAAGAPSGARAGFDASNLIPKFMRGFARGMYVEGVVGSRNDTQQRGVGVGVRVEVALPKDFVTSMGYGPGTVWSTDVYWSP